MLLWGPGSVWGPGLVGLDFVTTVGSLMLNLSPAQRGHGHELQR
jgi:hypothetical protein